MQCLTYKFDAHGWGAWPTSERLVETLVEELARYYYIAVDGGILLSDS
jgi:hypothetical protein